MSDSDEEGISVEDELVDADSSEEELGDEPDEYEKDGFVVDTVDDGDEEGGEEVAPKKRKRRSRHLEEELDAEDMSLIAENTGVKVSRNRDGKFKRLKKKVEDEEDDLFGVSDEEGKHKEKDEAFLSGEEDDEDNWIVHDPRERRRASHYVGSSAIEEAEEIFDDREYQSYLTQRVTGEKRDALSVYKANFEPSLLEEKYITEKDKAIRELDFPERIQVHFEEIGKDVESYEPEESSLNKEAAWIYARALKRCPKTSIPKIAAVLGFILKDKYDIPLITNYRKDYYMPDLEKQHVWQIAHWDVKWHHLEQRKEQLRKVFLQSRENSGSDELTNDDDELNLIDSTNTEEEVNDLLDHFQLTFSPDNSEASGNGTRHRRPVKQDAYRTIKNAPGISELSKLFGLTAKQFGENMMDAVAKHQAVDHELAPLDLAEEYIERSGFPSAESVLKACRLILAQEIAYDPHVRQSIRQIFFDKTTLSTDPTILGKSVIDDFHPYWQIKRLRRKPIKRFEGSADFLEILKAQEEGLLTFKVEFPNESAQAKIVKEMENLYCSTGYSAISEEWNNQRRHILQEALGHLVTLFEKEIRQKLEQEAKEHVVSAVSTKLAKMLNVSPYISPKRSGEIATVMACCWGAHTGTGTGSDPTTFVMLNDDGQPIDSLRLRFMGLSSKDTAAPLDRERKKSDLKQLQDFILKHEPEVIAVGATELAAVRLVDDIKYLLRTSVEDRPIHYVDPAVPNAAKDSSRYREEFKDLPTYMRQTISLGRFLQDPLMEMASLCTATDEILCLKFHPLQGLVNHDDLVKAIHREFIIATNEAGVDINKAVLYKSASSTLQFVSGLGPRKALELIQSISRHGKRVTHRSVPEEDDDFESINKHLSKFVFYNAAPFLRIPERYANFNEEVDIISNTRIHPEDELFAGRMAEDALDERPRKMSIRTLMTRLSKSSNRATLLERELDLDSAAADWQQKTGVPKRRTLYDIRNELIHNYKDSRQPFKDPTPDELFSMLTSETDQTLNEGQLVTAKITAIRKGAVVDLRLESGLEGTIDYKILTEYARKCEESDTPLPPITVGSALSLQVERVNKNGFSVDLIPPNPSLRPRRPTVEYLAKDDPLDDLDEKISAPKEKKDRKIRRPINHPVFKNMTYQEVLDYFRDRETGEFVIRPSSRGLDHLTISWKLKDLIIHVDVQEKEKPYKNSLKIGKKLVIGKETYESLDELTERYIKPVLDFSQEMLKFRSFMEGRDAEISHFLKKEKEGDPRRIPYYVGLSYDSPGRFVLYYLPMQRVKKEFITVTPEGYRLRQKYFKRPDKLIQWFKTHFRNLPVPRPRAPEKDDWDDDDTPATRTDDRQHAPPAVAPGGWPMNPAWGGMAPYPPMAVAGAPMGMGYPPHGLPPAPGMVPPPGFPRPPWGMVMPAPGMGMPGVGMPPVPGQAPLSVPSSSSSGRDHHSSSSSRGYSSSSYDRHSSSSRGGDRDRDRDRGDRDRDRDYDRRGSSSSYHDRSSGGDRYSSSSSSRGGSTSSSSTSHQEDSWD